MVSNLDRVLGEFQRTGLVWFVSPTGDVTGREYDTLTRQEKYEAKYFLTEGIARIKAAILLGRS